MSEKKGLSPLAWVGIGCGGIVILVLVVTMAVCAFAVSKVKDFAEEFDGNPEAAAAALIVKAHPDLELVDTDLDKSTITVRNTDTDEVVTLNFDDIKEGRFSFESSEGKVNIDASEAASGESVKITTDDGELRLGGAASQSEIPDWVPIIEGADEIEAAFSQKNEDGLAGSFTFPYERSMSVIRAWYEAQLEEDGFKTQVQAMDSDGQSFVVINASSQDETRSLTVTLVEQEGKIVANINYSDSKP